MAPPAFTREPPEEDEAEPTDGPYARVLACAYSPDKTVPAFFCFLDGSGQVIDFLRLNNLLKRKYSPFDREREEKVTFLCVAYRLQCTCMWSFPNFNVESYNIMYYLRV
jgi:hypothetical protein